MNDGFAIARVYPGDLNALVKNLMKATGVSDPNELVRSVNAGEWVLTPVALAVEKFLGPASPVMLNITQSVKPSEFLQTRDGLWVDPSFAGLFIDDIPQSVGPLTLSKYPIINGALDSQIRGELPVNHEFEAHEFCEVLISQLTKQWGGKTGELLNNGYANIFYVWNKQKTRLFVVRVYWYGGVDYREWYVGVWGLDGIGWAAGRSVFSRN